MDGFQKYFEESEEEEDIKRTLAKLPEAHRNFVRGFKISFQGRNTLNNDGEHVGVVQTHPKPEIRFFSMR